MFGATAWYREYAPCDALRNYVRTFFRLSPVLDPEPDSRDLISWLRIGEGRPSAPPLADGHVSLVFCFENVYLFGRCWRYGPTLGGWVIGPMSAPGSNVAGGVPERVGVSLRAGQTRAIFGVPGVELADRSVAIEDLWGPAAANLAAELADLPGASRIDRLELMLLRRMQRQPSASPTLDLPGLAQHIVRAKGLVRIDDLAGRAGVSRQYLTRAFRDSLGITPKLFARLARFHAGLAFAGCSNVDWAQAALDLGYADQSHMIAEFREFSSMTPDLLAARDWFHPFIQRAQRAYSNTSTRVAISSRGIRVLQ